MAAAVVRYKWLGPRQKQVQAGVPSLVSFVLPLGSIADFVFCDVSIADDAFRADLDDAMLDQGWQFFQLNPLGLPPMPP